MPSSDCTDFAFVVPDGCTPGTMLKVRAPDGVTLHIPCPGNISGGDKLFMAKDSKGGWGISKAEVQQRPAEAAGQWRAEESLKTDLEGPEVVKVKLETTKGPISLQVVPSWAPLGAKRFLQLVDDGFFSDLAVYRAIPGGLVQFGIVQGKDPRSTKYEDLEDDPLIGVPFEDGTVTFAAASSGTRRSTVCIFLGDFRDQLGYKQPETPFGKVCPESMDTLHSLYTGYGDMPQVGGNGPDPEKIEEWGNDYVKVEFPKCDFVLAASRLP